MNHFILPNPFRLLALSLACVTFSAVAADPAATDGLTPEQILARMAATYATCKSYHDTGVVTNDFGPHSAGDHFPRHVVVKPFRTAFVRPDRFRFEYDDPTPEQRYVIWASGDEVRTWWHLKPGVEKPASLDEALAGATGVSSGSAHTVPALLLPVQVGGRKLTTLTNLTRLPDEAWDNTPCFKLEGKYANTPMTLWLEKATYLVVRIYQDTDLAKTTTVYRPQVNIEIPAKELEFDAPEKQ